MLVLETDDELVVIDKLDEVKVELIGRGFGLRA
jgi:hypothetical protein